MTTLTEWCQASHALAVEKGFHEGADPHAPERIAARLALIHAEVSEALECVARGKMAFRIEDGKPEGFGVELADVFLRLCDLAQSTGADLEAMVEVKHEFNKTRPIRHGGKRI